MSPLRGRGNARFPDRGPGYDEDGTAATVTELERRPWQSRGGSKL